MIALFQIYNNRAVSPIRLSASIDWRMSVQSLSRRTGSRHRFKKPLEHGRADDSTFCVQLFADANLTIHDALERNVWATCVHFHVENSENHQELQCRTSVLYLLSSQGYRIRKFLKPVIRSPIPWNTSVPPTTRRSAYNSLLMQTSQFMTTHVDSTAERAFK